MSLAVPRTAAPSPLVSFRRLEELLGRDRNDFERIAGKAGRFYRPFDLWRPEKAKWRHIDNPTGELKVLQDRVNRRILSLVPLPDTMLGAVPGRSIRDNAAPHVGQPLVVALDLRDFFPRTHDLMVYRTFRAVLGCSPETADTLTKLTTIHHRIPQGAPTSSTLANLVVLPLHDEIQRLARERGLRCTFWVDDIVLSGATVLDAVEDVIRAIQKYGYAIRRKKLRRMPANDAQVVTGAMVNRKISADRKYRKKIRAEILAFSGGIEIPERFLQRIRGQIGHVRFLQPSQAGPLERLLERKLVGRCVEGPGPVGTGPVRRPCPGGAGCCAANGRLSPFPA